MQPATMKEMSRLEDMPRVLLFDPRVQAESFVYRICDIWMKAHDCEIGIDRNAETIDPEQAEDESISLWGRKVFKLIFFFQP